MNFFHPVKQNRTTKCPYDPLARAQQSLCRDDIALLQAVAQEIGNEKALNYFGFDYAGRKLSTLKQRKKGKKENG